jgi:formate-dependent nitrite reductase membrane component NrfD
LFFAAALATLLERNGDTPHARIARYGALLAPWPVMAGCLLLIFDLGKWYRFYKLFLHVRWVSPMSIGSWLLLIFSGISLLFFIASLTVEQRQRLFKWVPAGRVFLRVFAGDLAGWRRPLAAAGLPFSVGVGIYTGVLLGAVQSRPFWNTNLVAQMFLFSALSTGCAALILALAARREGITASEFRLLYTLDICFLTLEFFIVLPYLIHGQLSVQAVRDSLQLILGGPFTLVFWVFFLGLGLLAPLAVEVREMAPALLSRTAAHCSRPLAAVAAVLVLAGGFLLRYIFVFAGQMSAFK